MKTKTTKRALFIFSFFLFALSAQAQTPNLVGPQEVCVGDCVTYIFDNLPDDPNGR